MKKILLPIVLALGIQLLSAASASGANLDYTVTVENSNSLAHVRLTISNIPSGVSSIRLSIAVPKYSSEQYVKNLMVTSENGSVLSSIHSENIVWVCEVATGGENSVTVEYDAEQLIPSALNEEEYYSYIGPAYAAIDGSYLFLTPDNLSTSSIKVRVETHVAGWTVITPWQEAENEYEVDQETALFRYVLLGPFTKTERTGDGVTTVIVRHQSVAVMVSVEDEFGGLEKLTDFYRRAFGLVATDKTFWVTVPPPMYLLFKQGNTVIRSTKTLTKLSFWEGSAHEYCHMWNGGLVRFKDSARWFKEGGTNYFADLALLGTGLGSESELKIFNAWNYYKSKLSLVDEPLAGTSSTDMIYTKGELVTYLLNERIEEATGGQKNIYDFAGYLFQNYSWRVLSNDDILRAVNAATGQDSSDFFSKYVYGTEKLQSAELDSGELSVPTLPGTAAASNIRTLLMAAAAVICLIAAVCIVVWARKRLPKKFPGRPLGIEHAPKPPNTDRILDFEREV